MATLPQMPFTQNNIETINMASVDRNAIINTLSKKSNMLDYLGVFPSNDKSSYRNFFISGMPTVGLRADNQGYRDSSLTVATNFSSVVNFSSSYTQSKDDLRRATPESLMMIEENFLTKMKETIVDAVYYGANDSVTGLSGFESLTQKYSSGAASSNKATYQYILNAGSTTDNANTSIWVMDAGESKVHFFYDATDQGDMPMGIRSETITSIPITDQYGYTHYGNRYLWDWTLGFNVGDFRRCVRIANINVADLKSKSGTQNPGNSTTPTSSTYVGDLILEALAMLPSGSQNAVIFMRPEVAARITTAQPNLLKSGDNFRNLYTQFADGGIYGGYALDLNANFSFNGTRVYTDQMIRLNESLVPFV